MEDLGSPSPRGITAGSGAVARGAARALPQYRWGFYGAAAAVSLAQVPRGAHYPGDVLAGTLIGLMADSPARAISGAVRTQPTTGCKRGRVSLSQSVS